MVDFKGQIDYNNKVICERFKKLSLETLKLIYQFCPQVKEDDTIRQTFFRFKTNYLILDNKLIINQQVYTNEEEFVLILAKQLSDEINAFAGNSQIKISCITTDGYMSFERI